MILKSTLIVFSANALAHLINYLYHLIAGRFLIPDQFGLLESFVSLNYFLAVIISSFSLSIIHQLNLTKTAQKPALIHHLQSLSLKLTLAVWLIFLSLSPALKSLLHLNNSFLIIVFSIQIIFSFLPTLYASLLRAKLKFNQFTLVNLLSPLTKTLSALILFLLGFKVLGALISLSLAGLIPAVFSFYLVKKHFPGQRQNGFQSKTFKLPPSFYKFSFVAFLTNLSLTSLYNSDLLLVRFFISRQSGLYAAISILGKIIFFISSAVLTVAFPVFATQTNNLKKLKNSFQKSLLLITAIAFFGTAIYQLYPDLIIKLFSNPAYAAGAAYLPSFSLFIFFFTILNLVIQLLLLLNKRLALISSVSTALLQLILILLFHQNLIQIIKNSIVASLTGLIICLISLKKTLYS